MTIKKQNIRQRFQKKGNYKTCQKNEKSDKSRLLKIQKIQT